ncbi:N-acetylglucosamine-6-phosphate deacetylase [Pelosinus sp. IPA-1]|uniref:N-acetylglucosamine-6-phosphate deacetylase n=1 Tax=Pelosinus sp. IPA-1 TaxID=3029569 RepID=UPI00243623B6|nr:N-acetylglucosamine-6-phosphate deacetylase [Pelosinus sp. IPA-1]GMA98666.1 N-acetylglucosamine-6-phosphate deacetylase [Pelosinus sp. IPA-1]
MERLRYAIAAGKIYTEDEIIENGVVIVENGSIVAIKEKDANLQAKVLYDFSEFQVLPGLIDTHIHGANGCDTMQADFTALNEISNYLATKGITAFVPTTVTDELPKIKRALANVNACMGEVEGAQILGSYVEGPYITPEHRGAHPEKLIREIRLTEMEELIVASGNTVRTVALAPEKQNSLALIKYLHQVGTHVAIGHTSATYEEVQQAAEAGANIAVHTYNGMRGLHHQEPGTLGAVLVNDKIYTELIADFTHAHPAAMEILLRCKPKDKVILISDAIEATGLPDGKYMLGTLQIVVKKGIARTESGSLAGSTTNLLQCVQGLIEKMAVPPLSAVHMASLNPSKLLGVDSIIGSIKRGKQADFVVVDNNFEVVMTVVKGKVVYQR